MRPLKLGLMLSTNYLQKQRSSLILITLPHHTTPMPSTPCLLQRLSNPIKGQDKPKTYFNKTLNPKLKVKHIIQKTEKMSVASSIPCIKIPPSSSTSSSTSSSSSSSSLPSSLRFPGAPRHSIFTIRSAQTDQGPLRRPAAPPLREPSPPSPAPPPTSPSPSPSSPPKSASAVDATKITLEFQRLKAKELQDYFKQKKLEEADQGPFFGFLPKNEISNGRWAMFGFAVGMLTEFATGSDFVDQVKILLSNFGIVDLE
ncbi:light-harvesting complex-like protein OHP2, chloroplastic [Malania oleifera]|uniref:light-harvesting complex-like protein OHP2, chloroplastic n=1 Tax=Malania oleifera TaxID=397392 RepID=UPI0025AE3E8D|nr:light-harvesting complex-like protein OHP2, chloroplastic [Malania oleifera]